MKKLTIFLRLTAVFTVLLSSSFKGNSQSTDSTTAAITYDPIVATLDSLVNQSYIERLGAVPADNSGFGEKEIPSYADDIYRKRIEKIQTPIPLAYNSEVKQYITMYAIQKRGLTERVMGLAQLYFPLYEQILDQQELPLEFKYLSIVESALNPMAVSPVGATGLWQFMFATGKIYGLQVTSYTDERRDPVKSTYAACQYFKDMYAIYNDWLLVIAAYNCGAGNVNRAIARSGGKKTFWEISPYLPRETRGYVPAFIAVTYLMNYTSEHNLTAVAPLINYFEVDTVMVDHRMDLQQVAAAVNTPYDVIKYLNPIYKRGIIPDGEEARVLRLPTNRINLYLANEANLIRPAIEASENFAMVSNVDDIAYEDVQIRKTHRVRKGEHLQLIARKYHVTVAELKQWNHLRSTKLSAGQRLTVMVDAPKKKVATTAVASNAVKTSDTSLAVTLAADSVIASVDSVAAIATSAPMKVSTISAENSGIVYHVVVPGDTLWKIAQRYEGLTVEKIKKINKLDSNDLKVGTRLKLATGG